MILMRCAVIPVILATTEIDDMKVVINVCFGGFSLSDIAIIELRKRRGACVEPYYDLPRDNPTLVAVVEALGEQANGKYAELKVVEVPDDVEWFIDEYDGVETIHEKHRTW